MFLLYILLGLSESIDVASGPEAVLQPDHRHKLTTCVLVHKPDELPDLETHLDSLSRVRVGKKYK